MSRLLGPLSETMSSVSWRDCALADDQIAGAEIVLAAVSAVTDLRNSRRLMKLSPGWKSRAAISFRKGRATAAADVCRS
jgi:hypothetical protein